MATVQGSGYSGLGTSGPENTKTHIGRPDIAGADNSRYTNLRKGINIQQRKSRKKTKHIPKII